VFALRQLEVTTAEWWAGLAEWVIKGSVLVAAITLLFRTPIIRPVLYRFFHWLWNFPLISMTIEGLRDLVRDEIEPLKEQVAAVGADVADLRAENAEQHAEVTDQIRQLADTVSGHTETVRGHSERLAAVELALMTRRRRDDRGS